MRILTVCMRILGRSIEGQLLTALNTLQICLYNEPAPNLILFFHKFKFRYISSY
jgi:hypothetical protein